MRAPESNVEFDGPTCREAHVAGCLLNVMGVLDEIVSGCGQAGFLHLLARGKLVPGCIHGRRRVAWQAELLSKTCG